MLSTPRWVKLADSMSYRELMNQMTMTYGAEPSMTYAALYGLAMKLAKRSFGVSDPKKVITEVLDQVQDQAMKARLGWLSIGASHEAMGTMLTMSGVGATLGMNLIMQGVGDIVDAVWAGVAGEAVDWASYWTKKGISCLMMVVGAAAKTLQHGGDFAKGFSGNVLGGAMTKEVVNEAGKRVAVDMTAAEMGKEIGFTITKSVGAGIAGKLTNIGLSRLRERALGEFKEQVGRKAREKVEVLYVEEGFRVQVSRIMTFDAGTRGKWKVEQGVAQQMNAWIQGNESLRTAVELLKTTLGTIATANKDMVWLTATGDAVFAAHNVSAAFTFMDAFVEELRRVVAEAEAGLKTALESLQALSGEEVATVEAFLAKLNEQGIIVGNTPYQIQARAGQVGVTSDAGKAQETINAVASSMELSTRSGGGTGGTPTGLASWANWWVKAPGWVDQQDGVNKHAEWAVQVCSSGMMGELRQGIAGQVQGELQGVVMGVGAAVASAMAEDWKTQRRVALEGTSNRTAAEQMELSELQAEDRNRLKDREAAAKQAGEVSPLSEEETSRLRGYEARDAFAREQEAQQQAAREDALMRNRVLRPGAEDGYVIPGVTPGVPAEVRGVDPEVKEGSGTKEPEHTWYGDARSWLADKLSVDLPGDGDQNFMPWVGSEAFVQLGIDQKIDEGAWLEYSQEERDAYIRSKAHEYREQQSLAMGINLASEIPGAIARQVGEWVSEGLSSVGTRDAVANDTGQFVTDVGEWIGFGAAAGIMKEMSLVGKVAEGMPLRVFRRSERIVLEDGTTQVVKKISKVEYCQIHHILSDKNDLIVNNPLLRKAGFDLNDPINKMLLPTVTGAERSSTFRSIHQGRHVEKYSEELAEKMSRIERAGEVAGWTQAQYREKLERLISETRQRLKHGEIKLNRRTRESEGLPTLGGDK